MRAKIEDQGNGLPQPGEYVAHSDGLYEVISIDSRIQTEQWRADYVYATVTPAEWSDVEEGEEHTARVTILGPNED